MTSGKFDFNIEIHAVDNTGGVYIDRENWERLLSALRASRDVNLYIDGKAAGDVRDADQ